jgi:hypothetical protein
MLAAAQNGMESGEPLKQFDPNRRLGDPVTPIIWLTLILLGAIQQSHEKLESAVKR